MKAPFRTLTGVSCVAALLFVIGIVAVNLWHRGGDVCRSIVQQCGTLPQGASGPAGGSLAATHHQSSTAGVPPSGSNPTVSGRPPTVKPPPPTTGALPPATYLAELTANTTIATTTGSCTTAGRTFTRSLIMSVADRPARVDYLSLPAQYTTLTASIGPVDTTDPKQQYGIRVFVQTGLTPPNGAPNIVWDKTIPYGASETIVLTIRRGEFLRVQASTGTPRQACIGDIRLTP